MDLRGYSFYFIKNLHYSSKLNITEGKKHEISSWTDTIGL